MTAGITAAAIGPVSAGRDPDLAEATAVQASQVQPILQVVQRTVPAHAVAPGGGRGVHVDDGPHHFRGGLGQVDVGVVAVPLSPYHTGPGHLRWRNRLTLREQRRCCHAVVDDDIRIA